MPQQPHEYLRNAIDILESLGFLRSQLNDLCGYVLLALCEIGPNSTWDMATKKWVRIHDIIRFISEKYNKEYAENSRETIRKKALHHFRIAAIIEDNGTATNSPNYRYRLTDEFFALIKTRGTSLWQKKLNDFKEIHHSLEDLYESERKRKKFPVKINKNNFSFSPGKHNELQKAIIEVFSLYFAPGSECLYVGDTIKKDLYKNDEKLKQLGFKISVHDKMPDVILYRADKDWIYFIEAVTSVGPMDPKRIIEINEMTNNVKSGKIFITAFLDVQTYKKFIDKIAWETEVWIANMPEHLIHLNGHKFMGPY